MKSINPVLAHVYDLCVKSAMALAILLLPFTSLPLLSRLMGGTQVAPPTLVFIFVLTVGWLPLYLARGGKILHEMLPFLVFIILACISSAAAFFLNFPSYKGFTIRSAEVNALFTLAIGSVIYIVISLWHQEPSRMAFTLKLINWSGIALLAWSSIQLVFILFRAGHYPETLVQLQAFISTRSLLDPGFRTRLGGFTYEPSWLAHQLNLIYLPYWLASTITGYSITKKVWHVSLENLLLVGGLVTLYFTVSRVGLLAVLLMIAFIFYRFNVLLIRWLRDHIKKRPAIFRRYLDRSFPFLSVLVIVLVYIGGVVAVLVLWSHFDPRTEKLLSLRTIPTDLFNFARKVGFAERVVYWSIGWSVFARYPLLGVGLGNTGFFFQQYVPNIGYRLTEIIEVLYQSSYLPNIKSFWIRLLAETGLLGFSAFGAWQVVLWYVGIFLRTHHSVFVRTLGWMGAFAILAFLAEGLSIDSFALPYLFVAMGLLTASSAIARQQRV